jgi:hypothetical protein
LDLGLVEIWRPPRGVIGVEQHAVFASWVYRDSSKAMYALVTEGVKDVVLEWLTSTHPFALAYPVDLDHDVERNAGSCVLQNYIWSASAVSR